MGKFCSRKLNSILGLPAVGDVTRQRKTKPLLFLSEFTDANLDRKRCSVLTPVERFESHWLSCVDAIHQCRKRLFVDSSVKVARVHANQFLPAVTEAFTGLAVDVYDGQIVGMEEKGIGGMVDEGPKASFARSQPLLCSLALGQVEHEGHGLVPSALETCLTDHHGYVTAVLSLVHLFKGADAAVRSQLGLGFGVTLAPFRRWS
ncbi:hypothetical protein RCCGEPOP_02771, partial [Rhizobium sp. Pop5]